MTEIRVDSIPSGECLAMLSASSQNPFNHRPIAHRIDEGRSPVDEVRQTYPTKQRWGKRSHGSPQQRGNLALRKCLGWENQLGLHNGTQGSGTLVEKSISSVLGVLLASCLPQ